MSPANKARLALLRSAPLNKWIALSEDETRIVAVGENFLEVSEKSDEAGETDPVILKTPVACNFLFPSKNSTVRIPYKVYPDKNGSLYSAVLGVNLALPTPHAPRTKRIEAIIDSGASRCLFHADIARYLGLDLKSGIQDNLNGIGGLEENWLHEVSLYIPGGSVKILAGFMENLSCVGLLGMTGFFDNFTVTFDPAALECDLVRIYRA